MILFNQRQGYIVEGQEMPKTHRLNPVNKDVLGKMIKNHQKQPERGKGKPRTPKKKRKNFASDHVMPNTTNVSDKMPSGSYAS
jgi:hypothetical protein